MLFCITANYTPKAMQAMAKKPEANRSLVPTFLLG
jgi:hypothetical protein